MPGRQSVFLRGWRHELEPASRLQLNPAFRRHRSPRDRHRGGSRERGARRGYLRGPVDHRRDIPHPPRVPDRGRRRYLDDVSGTDGAGPVGNLPDLPLHSVVFDQSATPSAIIVAGDSGVMRCSDASVTGPNVKATWKIYGAGLPNVSCMSLAIDNTVKPPVLRVGTYGRGCFEATRPHGPAMSVESSLGFGFARQGTGNKQPLYIYNSGDAALTISAITRTFGSADFAIGAVTLPATVAPGVTLTVPVLFTPSSVGDLQAVFQIASNDPHSPYALVVSGP